MPSPPELSSPLPCTPPSPRPLTSPHSSVHFPLYASALLCARYPLSSLRVPLLPPVLRRPPSCTPRTSTTLRLWTGAACPPFFSPPSPFPFTAPFPPFLSLGPSSVEEPPSEWLPFECCDWSLWPLPSPMPSTPSPSPFPSLLPLPPFTPPPSLRATADGGRVVPVADGRSGPVDGSLGSSSLPLLPPFPPLLPRLHHGRDDGVAGQRWGALSRPALRPPCQRPLVVALLGPRRRAGGAAAAAAGEGEGDGEGEGEGVAEPAAGATPLRGAGGWLEGLGFIGTRQPFSTPATADERHPTWCLFSPPWLLCPATVCCRVRERRRLEAVGPVRECWRRTSVR